ncbi:MAG: SH3 domain-containing protein [Anaerolineae bacterium]
MAQDTVSTSGSSHAAYAPVPPALSSAGTASEAALASSPFTRSLRMGINHVSGIDIPDHDTRYAHALTLGAGWDRWALYWNRVETQPPAAGVSQFDWSAYDAVVSSEMRVGLNIDVVLLGIPDFHTDGNSIAALNEPIFADGTDQPALGKTVNPNHPFAVFVQAAVERYKPEGRLAAEQGWAEGRGVRVWEVWNEPDYTAFWRGGVNAYARMLQVAYLVAHSVDPDATVMVGGLLYPTQHNWLAEVLHIIERDPARETYNWYFDAVAVHSYTDAWRSGWLTLYVRQTMIEYNIMRPIWLNESGAPVWDDYPGATWLTDTPARRRDYLTAEEAAAYFIQSAAWAYAEGAQVVFLFQLYDDCGNQSPGTDFPPDDPALCTEGHACYGDAFGIYTNPANAVCFAQHQQPDTARPVAAAYRRAADIFGEVPFSPRGVIDTTSVRGIVTITFSRPATDERMVIAWNLSTHSRTLNLPAFGTSATLYTLDGVQSIMPSPSGDYALDLPPAPVDRLPPTDPSVIPNGGMPVILIEPLSPAQSLNLQARTGVAEPQIASLPANTALSVSSMTMQSVASSSTAAVFTALEHARLRTLPDTESGQIVGQLSPNTRAIIIGRLADASWVQVNAGGQGVWVAAFLGVISGDLSQIPVVDPSVIPAPTAVIAAGM